MTQRNKVNHPKPSNDEAYQHFLTTHVRLPKALLGSRTECESYLDSLTSKVLLGSQIPHSRS